MPTFQYEAMDNTGLEVKDTIEAPSEPGVEMADIPYYQLPFGPDENGEARPFWPSRMTTANGRMSDPAHIPSAVECAECHSREFEEWAPSLHAVAGTDAIYEKTVDANARLLRHGVEQGRFCEGCHAPGELLSGRTNRFASVAPSDSLIVIVTPEMTLSINFCINPYRDVTARVSPSLLEWSVSVQSEAFLRPPDCSRHSWRTC